MQFHLKPEEAANFTFCLNRSYFISYCIVLYCIVVNYIVLYCIVLNILVRVVVDVESILGTLDVWQENTLDETPVRGRMNTHILGVHTHS